MCTFAVSVVASFGGIFKCGFAGGLWVVWWVVFSVVLGHFHVHFCCQCCGQFLWYFQVRFCRWFMGCLVGSILWGFRAFSCAVLVSVL
jgi:hypothetical protein